MNHLSKNIRYLRKLRNWSQEELASRLEVKRSNIASYESKNVRPRLDLVLALSRLFGVKIADLIERDLANAGRSENGQAAEPLEERISPTPDHTPRLNLKEHESVETFIEKSIGIRKMLEGFKTFYRLKLENIGELDEDARRLTADIENFLLLMEHLLTYNEAIIRAVSPDTPVVD